MLLINIFYIAAYLINFDSFTLNKLWIIFFLISSLFAFFNLLHAKKQSEHKVILSIVVLVGSIGSLGAYGFQFLIFHLMA